MVKYCPRCFHIVRPYMREIKSQSCLCLWGELRNKWFSESKLSWGDEWFRHFNEFIVAAQYCCGLNVVRIQTSVTGWSSCIITWCFINVFWVSCIMHPKRNLKQDVYINTYIHICSMYNKFYKNLQYAFFFFSSFPKDLCLPNTVLQYNKSERKRCVENKFLTEEGSVKKHSAGVVVCEWEGVMSHTWRPSWA